MEPLSLIASVTGLLIASTKVLSVLSDFVSRERDAPTTARSIVTEVLHLRLYITHLSPYLEETEMVPASRRAMIPVEPVVIISTSCVTLLSDLENTLNSFKLDQARTRMNKMRWARQEPKIMNLVSQLREARSFLSLILTALTW